MPRRKTSSRANGVWVGRAGEAKYTVSVIKFAWHGLGQI